MKFFLRFWFLNEYDKGKVLNVIELSQMLLGCGWFIWRGRVIRLDIVISLEQGLGRRIEWQFDIWVVGFYKYSSFVMFVELGRFLGIEFFGRDQKERFLGSFVY